MISPITNPLRCRSVHDKNGPEGFADMWVSKIKHLFYHINCC